MQRNRLIPMTREPASNSNYVVSSRLLYTISDLELWKSPDFTRETKDLRYDINAVRKTLGKNINHLKIL